MRRVSLLFAVLIVIPLLGSDAPKEYDGSMAADPLEGTWRLTDVAISGQNVNHCDPCELTMTIRGGFIKYSDCEKSRWQYRTAASRNPAELDLKGCATAGGSIVKCIYQIDGDTLRIAWISPSNEQRPLRFDDSRVFANTYRRVK